MTPAQTRLVSRRVALGAVTFGIVLLGYGTGFWR